MSKGIAKILKGVLNYNQTCKDELTPMFRQILDNPEAKSIFVSCIDSRIMASRILYAEPGSYYLARTPGNFIQKHENNETAQIPAATASAIELACVLHKCNTIGVIGHSDCKVNINFFSQNYIFLINIIDKFLRHLIFFMK